MNLTLAPIMAHLVLVKPNKHFHRAELLAILALQIHGQISLILCLTVDWVLWQRPIDPRIR